MKTKDLVSFGIAALVFSFVFQYFIGWRVGQQTGDQLQSGQKMTAPRAVVQTPELHQPLNTEIDFLDKESQRPEKTTVIDTPQMAVRFSNDGAMVTGLAFKRKQAGINQEFETISLDNLGTQRDKKHVARNCSNWRKCFLQSNNL